MSDLRTLIDDALVAQAAANGCNNEFALFFFRFGWRAEIGNPMCGNIALGEIPGEFCGDGDTPEAAVVSLIENIKADKSQLDHRWWRLEMRQGP